MSELIPETEVVYLWQGNDLARIEELEEAAMSAVNQSDPRTIGEADPVAEAAKVHDDFVTEAKARAVKATVQNLPRKQMSSLMEKHPPRQGNARDEALGFNEQTLADDLVPACLASVEPAPANTETFLDSLSLKNFRRLYSAAARVNLIDGPDPKADLSSRLVQASETT